MAGNKAEEATHRKSMSTKEKREQEDRLKRFLALPPQLQEGALRYADNIRSAYQAGR